jgi:CPA1 family monovalent cation:H+ antiporter
MDVISLVGIIAALFIVISLSEPLADWFRLPYTVVLAIIGTLIGIGVASLSTPETALGDPLTDPLAAAERLEVAIRANVWG